MLHVLNTKVSLEKLLGRFSRVLYMMFRVCMSVCLSYDTACKAGSYVCTYGAIFRIRRTEEYQSVGNKQTGEQQQMFVLAGFFLYIKTGE